jgi:hypothetical protein
MIQRLQRNAIVACVGMALLAAVIARSIWWAAAVIGGGVLIGISFLAIASGVSGIGADRADGADGADGADRADRADRADHRPGFLLLKVTGRYALLGFLAYVMIARLHLPPIGLIAGASSFAVAAAVESVSLFRKKH